MDPSTKSPTTLLLVVAMVFSLFSTTTPAAERITHIHTDALGSPVAATDEQGNIIWREKYQPYGERISNAPAASSNKRWYTGHQQDTETGLVYAGARYYDPTLGRFMAVDPVSFTEKNLHSFNRYTYGANNPYKYVDPDGRKIVFAPGSTSQFKNQVKQMTQYLNAGGVSGVIRQLEARPETVHLQEATAPHDFKYDLNTRTIVIDPRSGLEVSPGNVQTPALGLLHEADHALQDLQNPQQLRKDLSTPVPAYHNREEQRVIVGTETPAAIRLKEPVRTHHGGIPVRVQCPTCVR